MIFPRSSTAPAAAGAVCTAVNPIDTVDEAASRVLAERANTPG
jgi:hypothetical protein